MKLAFEKRRRGARTASSSSNRIEEALAVRIEEAAPRPASREEREDEGDADEDPRGREGAHPGRTAQDARYPAPDAARARHASSILSAAAGIRLPRALRAAILDS